VLRTERLRDEATKVAGRASSTSATSTFFAVVGIAALAVAVVAALPAEAKKRQNSAKPIEEPIPDIANGEPMTLVVSLSNQKVDVYRGTTLITSSKVSTGMPGHATKMGVFSILEKQRYHHSNIYSGAPMPWMNRITWSGTALHAGVVPGYPASHGCIRLPFSFAPKLFQITTPGDNVIVSRDRLAPQLIEHPNLFQPLPPPPLPVMVKQEQPPQRQSSNEILPVPAAQPGHPGMLARADLAGSTTDVPSSLEAEAAEQEAAPALKADADAAVEDTHVHAFDPFASAPAQAGMQTGHAAPTESAAGASGHALDDAGGPSSGSGTVSAASVDRAPVEAPEPVPAMAETSASAMAPAEPASVIAKTPPAEAANVAVEAAPVPATAVPMVVQGVAATPQASMAEANAKVDAGPPSIIATKLGAGTKAAGIMAAEPRSTAPLRILVTRRTQRDRIIGVQQLLAEMGYLPQLDFDGTLGKPTATAIKAFQKANWMPETGAFTDELVKRVYVIARKGEPPAGHLFVRQEFGRVFDAPVSFRDPETPLGTHLFTAQSFAPGDTKARWTAISLQGDDASSALDRLEIPNDLRQKISERLTPGSSLIIGDTAINSATLPKGGDFLVWAKDTPAKITTVSADGDNSVRQPKKKYRSVRRNNFNFSYSPPRSFTRGYPSWPW
jgi:L,D-transpeptidase catalytic domain/Putative peptidoglycan binding domain